MSSWPQLGRDCGHVLCRLRPQEPCLAPPSISPAYRPLRQGMPHRMVQELEEVVGPAASAPEQPDYVRGRDVLEALRRVESELEARRTRDTLAGFVRAGWEVLHPSEPLEWAWYLEAICDHVQAVLLDLVRARRGGPAQRTRDLLINCPPRLGKTLVVQVYAPAWIWLHDPSLKIRCVSGNPRVISDASRYCREVITSEWYQDTFKPKWQIRGDADAVQFFANTARGERKASSSGQRVTGEGSDVILCDDPHDAQEAHSEAKREEVKNKWKTSIRNRVNGPRHARIGVCQRVHEADWSADFLASGAEHLNIPMEHEAQRGCRCPACLRGETFLGFRDPRTQEGEILHPERYDAEWIRREKIVIGSYNWAGQMQQRPAPAEGGMFKKAWWKFFDELPRLDTGLLISVDAAFGSVSDTASRTSILVLGRCKAFRYVLDNDTRVMGPTEMLQAVRAMRRRWQDGVDRDGNVIPGWVKRPVSTVLIERKANGMSMIETLTMEGIQGVVPFDPVKDSKEARANAVQPIVEAGNVMLPRGAPWVDDFIHELGVFPNGQHDDQVDALSQALIHMRGSSSLANFVAASLAR